MQSNRSNISLEDIRRATQDILALHHGRPPALRLFRRRRSRYTSSYPIENILMVAEDSQGLHLVLKDLSPEVRLNAARPAALYNPQREIAVYRDVLTGNLSTPTYYGSIVDTNKHRYWLFLERLSCLHLWQMSGFEYWSAAACWLAELHSRSEAPERARSLSTELVNYDRQHFTESLTKAEKCISRSSSVIESSELRHFGRLVDNYDKILDRIGSIPVTFVHGDFFPSNVMIRTGGPNRAIAPIDWELAGFGPTLLDLAALTAGDWEPRERAEMISAYYRSLEPGHAWPPKLDELSHLVDCCHLQICIQLLGWAPEWKPPPRHDRDWFRIALALAGTLGV